MSTPVVYHFDWDPAKARLNVANHGVTFQLATTVLRDPLALTVYDEAHSETEERWVTLGDAGAGREWAVSGGGAYLTGAEPHGVCRAHHLRTSGRARGEIRNYQEQPH